MGDCSSNQMCLLIFKTDVLREIQEDLFSVCVVVVLTQAVLDVFSQNHG